MASGPWCLTTAQQDPTQSRWEVKPGPALSSELPVPPYLLQGTWALRSPGPMPSRWQKSPAQAHGASTPVPVSLQGWATLCWATLFKIETWGQRFQHPRLSLGLVFKDWIPLFPNSPPHPAGAEGEQGQVSHRAGLIDATFAIPLSQRERLGPARLPQERPVPGPVGPKWGGRWGEVRRWQVGEGEAPRQLELGGGRPCPNCCI